MTTAPADRYLDVMEKILTGMLIEDPPIVTDSFRTFYRSMVLEITGNANPSDAEIARYNPDWRAIGWDWPTFAFTMIGLKRLQNFRALIETAIEEGIQGDIVETGVWRGGASIMAKAVIETRGDKSRRVVLADSFEGLPPPDLAAFPQDAGSTLHQETPLAVTLEQVRKNFERFSLLDERVVFLKGWFRDTMPAAPVDRIAVLRLDGDMYESTILPLRYLYDKVSPGGFVIVDDYWLGPCKAAIHDFLAERGIGPEVIPIDGMGVYFRKP
jgi:hypothetical protein